MALMRPTPPSSGALISLTVRQFSTNFERHACAEFRHGKRTEAGFIHTQVRNGDQETGSLREKMAGGLTF
jgi:hypothetical protein